MRFSLQGAHLLKKRESGLAMVGFIMGWEVFVILGGISVSS